MLKSNRKKAVLSVVAACLFLFYSCSSSNNTSDPMMPDDNHTDTNTPSTSTGYDEQYRPLIHFTPAKNWINDPNGMVYVNGVWHLFYQYNPYGADWGNMSWGHATSTDLIHWKEQQVAITKNALGDIFSGSAVVDKNNTAGFGANAIVALYTSNGDHQQQSIAYSTDGCNSFTSYSGNPVISNTDRADFRDPKVFWDETSGLWIMSLARGWTYAVDFYGSKDLKSWTFLSSFNAADYSGCNHGQWECPDLVKFSLNGKSVWVLIVNINPGGPILGSGTMYFVGDWDGKTFTATHQDYPMWMDTGMDNYAGVTWSNAPDGRKVLIGWMNNWSYAGSSPVTPWRSAMTLPRELGLTELNGVKMLTNKVVKEIDGIAGTWKDVTSELGLSQPYQLHIDIPSISKGKILLSNSHNEEFEMEIIPSSNLFITKRTSKSGKTDFSGSFVQPSMKSTIYDDNGNLSLDIYVDQSSIELFNQNGLLVQTNTVYPTSIYNKITLDGINATIKVRPLNNIWK
jgi:fructan beta-fructosidase